MNGLDFLFGIIGLAAFIWVTYNVWSDKESRYTTTMKVVWTIAAFFLSVVTAIVYYFVEKRGQ